MRRGRGGAVFGVLLALGCSADHHTHKGEVALEAHQLAAAEQSFRSALDRDPRHVPALAGLGWTYHLAGQRGAARSAFARCVDLAPESVECLRGLGSLALADGQPGVARDLLGRARAAGPDDPKVLASLALLDMTVGDAASARTRYDELVRRFPEDAVYRLGLAEATLRVGDATAAIELAEAALQLTDTPVRYQAMLWQLMARALVAASGGREDPERCDETAPPVRAWLDAADSAVAQAEALAVGLPDLPAVKRQVLRRRSILDEACPQGVPTASEVLAPESSP